MPTTRSGIVGAALATATTLSALLTGCGTTPDFEYLESEDGRVFAKIPSDWQVVSEGAVQFKFIDPQEFARFGVVAGDATQPWRADFNNGQPGVSASGYIEAQHLDARLRNAVRISDIARGQRPADATELRFDKVRVGDLTGYRSSYEYGEGDALRRVEDVYLTDQRRSAVYIASVECGIDCYERTRDDIVEVVESLWVES